jgi:hypothetical protein
VQKYHLGLSLNMQRNGCKLESVNQFLTKGKKSFISLQLSFSLHKKTIGAGGKQIFALQK